MRLILILSFLMSGAFASAAKKSNKANPDISLNGLFTYRTSDQGNDPSKEATNGFDIQEIELRLTSNIDTRLRGDVVLAMEKENGEFAIEPEEAFVETLDLPWVTVRAGKFFAFWGRHNQLHTHAFPFVDAALSREAILGEEGLNETGVAVSYLAPTPWYMELVIQGLNGDNTNVFGSNAQDDIAGVYYLKNLWELTDQSTLELDLGYGSGSDINNDRNHIYNATLMYKWRPTEKAKTTSFAWTTEYTLAERVFDENGAAQGRKAALSSWIQYQFSTVWWLQARTEFVDFVDNAAADKTKKNSLLVGYVPSEFSALRLQYDQIDESGSTEKENRVTLQLNVSIGAHPAHKY